MIEETEVTEAATDELVEQCAHAIARRYYIDTGKKMSRMVALGLADTVVRLHSHCAALAAAQAQEDGREAE